MERECACCGTRFTGRDIAHRYCHAAKCQRKRKSRWQQRKLTTDPSYRGNQSDARKRWQKRHPEYWRAYRERHPDYEAQNRQRQRLRNRLRRRCALLPETPVIAKMDAATPVKSGTYRLIAMGSPLIANMDMMVELSLISTPYSAPCDCK